MDEKLKALFNTWGRPQLAGDDDAIPDEWGAPTVHEFTSPLGHEAPTVMRGGAPQWAPGEFDEWKQSHLSGMPTQYGKVMQDRYRRSSHRILAAPGQLEHEDQALLGAYPGSSMLDNLRKQYS